MTKISNRFVLFLLGLLTMSARAENPDDCADLVHLERGKNCGKPESVEMTLSNRCGSPMDLRFCLEMQNGKWNCGLQFAAPPGKTIKWLACEGTGKYQLWARTPKTSASFPDENGAYRSAGRAVFAVASAETEVSACKRARAMPGADGSCDCEIPDGSTGIVRCRVATTPEVTESNGRTIKPFEATMFSAKATARSKEIACTEARKLAGSPDGACTCDNKGPSSNCRVTSTSPSNSTIAKEAVKQLRCDPLLEDNCLFSKTNGGNGIRN